MTTIFKIFTAMWCLMAMAGGTLSAQNFTDRKVKVYRVQPGATVDITNKYGKVACHTWAKDSVQIVADIAVVSAQPEKVTRAAAAVKVEFTHTGTTIVANTLFDEGKGGFFTDLKMMAGSLLPNDTRVTINYTLYAPEYIHFRINNRFGDVFLDDLNGQVNLTLAYGNLKAGNLNGRSTLKITSGDADIASLADAVADIGFCDFILGRVKRLTISSYSSEIFVDQADFLKINSKRDKYKLQEVGELYGNGFFTHTLAYRLRNEAKYSQKFGSLTILEVNRQASYIGVVTEYADVETVMEAGAAIDVDISRSAESTLQLPGSSDTFEERSVGEKGEEIVTTGQFGKATHRIRVNIDALRKSNIRIFIK